jgi:hypothetical protein
MDKFLNSGDGWPLASRSPLLPGWLSWTRKQQDRIAMMGDCRPSERRRGITGRGPIRLRMFGPMSNNNSAANHGSRPRLSLTIYSDSIPANLMTQRAERSSGGLPTGERCMAPTKRCSSRKITTPADSPQATSPFAIRWV